MLKQIKNLAKVSTHSRPKAAASIAFTGSFVINEFQHTAARRRLLYIEPAFWVVNGVSTHSRPKAAAG